MIFSNGIIQATPGSMGDLVPTYSQTTFGGSSELVLSGSMAAYSAIYKTQLWVGVVVRKLAMATARNPFDVKRALEANGQEPEAGSLAALMARPSPRLSGFHLWLWTSSTFDIYGEAYWWKIRDSSGAVKELQPIHPTQITARMSVDDTLEYLYGAGQMVIPERDIVAFANYNPDTLRRGLSALEGLRMTLVNEDASRRATASWWKKGARPSVVLKHPGNLSAPALDRLKGQMDAEHSGADNMGRTLVLEEAMDAQIVQLSAEEMQYIESRKLNREEVCAAYDVPPPVVHILDKATFSNITEQLRSMYRDTMAPRFELFESVVDHQLVSDFYAPGEVFTKFNMDEVLRGDFETRATAVAQLIQTGVIKPSEARPMFGLIPAGVEADQLFANAALVPLGSNARAIAPVSTEGELMPVALSIAPRPLQVRSIMGQLAQVKADPTATRAKLVEAHQRELRRLFDEQRDAVLAAAAAKASGVFSPEAWDDPLTELLSTLRAATAKAIGGSVAAQLGGKYDGADLADWIDQGARESARNINRATAGQIDAAIAAMEEDDEIESTMSALFAGPIESRSDEIALSSVVVVAGLAALVAGRQSGAAEKTWNVNSRNPRSSHAAMAGETVGIDDVFSNGMNAPGDPVGGADEVAGCTCDVTFSF